MRTLQEKYSGVLEGKFSKTQFRRDAATELPQFVSNVNSFDDTVAILKNKGAITEAKREEKYFEAREVDNIAPDVLDTGIKFELDKKFGTLDVSKEDYEKAKETAVKNLTKDRAHYSKEVGEQLDTPGEKMEKAKLNEETDALFARNLKAAGHDYGKMFNALGDAVATGEGLEDASTEELKIYAQIALRLGDDIDVVNAFEYLENLPNYRPEFTPDNLRKANEAIQNIENDDQTKRRIAGLTNQLLKDVDPRDEDHAVKAYAISVKNDLESGDASRLKRYKDLLSIDDLKDDMRHYISHDVEQLEESQYSISDIQNKYPRDRAFDIQQAALRAVGATDVQAAYSKSAGEFEQALYKAAHGNLEEEVNEGEWEDKGQSKELNKKRLEDLKAKRAKGGPKGAIAVIDKQIAQLEKLVNEADIKLSAEDMEKLHKDGKITLPNGSVLHFVGKADEEVDATEKAASDKIGRGEEFTDDDAAAVADKMPKIKKDAEFKLIGEDEPDVEDLYQNSPEYLATLKQRKALKEMFKKIITKVIND